MQHHNDFNGHLSPGGLVASEHTMRLRCYIKSNKVGDRNHSGDEFSSSRSGIMAQTPPEGT